MKYISVDEIYKALARIDWWDLYLPVHFKQLIDELPRLDGEYTDQDVRTAYADGYSDGIHRGYEDAVRNYRAIIKEHMMDEEKEGLE